MAEQALSSIRTFRDSLSVVAASQLDMLALGSDRESWIFRALLDDQLISADRVDEDGRMYGVWLTPKGALALERWEAVLESRSWRGRLWAAADKLLWIAAGVCLSSLAKFLEGFMSA